MAADSTQLAVSRTRMAQERTLMAWVRTATSLISFGFAIDKFLERPAAPPTLFGARHFALTMIWIGLISLALATFQHVRSRRELQQDFGKQPFSVALIAAALIAGLGVLGLLAALTR